MLPAQDEIPARPIRPGAGRSAIKRAGSFFILYPSPLSVWIAHRAEGGTFCQIGPGKTSSHILEVRGSLRSGWSPTPVGSIWRNRHQLGRVGTHHARKANGSDFAHNPKSAKFRIRSRTRRGSPPQSGLSAARASLWGRSGAVYFWDVGLIGTENRHKGYFSSRQR